MLPDSYQLTTAPANLLIISMKEDHFVQILRNLAMRPPSLPPHLLAHLYLQT